MKKILIETGLIAFAGVVLVYIKKLKNDIHELEVIHQKEAGMIAQYSNEVNELNEKLKQSNRELMSNIITDMALCGANRESLEKVIERSREVIDKERENN